MKVIKFALALACGAGAAHAGQVFDGSGTGTGRSENGVIILCDDHMLMHSVGTCGPLATNDPDNPMAGLAGGGRFSNLTDRQTGTFENTITGALTMP